jgi:uncharacterized repeat protein (TIGR03803 family)
MSGKESSMPGKNVSLLVSTAMLTVLIGILALAPNSAAASKFKTLYKFNGITDGGYPLTSLIFDADWNLYGTTSGGASNAGTVFKLTPNRDGSWSESVLYRFCPSRPCLDGETPLAGLIFDQGGSLYGTTAGGGVYDLGTVFKLSPNADGSWTESVLYSFAGGNDGRGPIAGLIFDQVGNLYGDTAWGGVHGVGTVFKLGLNPDGTWTESVLHSFSQKEGWEPSASLVFDHSGNLYGTTPHGGRAGLVFELSPDSRGRWKEKVLHTFYRGQPSGSLIFDQAGNLYGTSSAGDDFYRRGFVFQLMPESGGGWKEKVLHYFHRVDGSAPFGDLTFDVAGNLYGTTVQGGNLNCLNGYGCGVVFKLSPDSDGGWKETVLHRFSGHPGEFPSTGVIFDAAGNLFGTTSGDDYTTFGSVFEIIQ